METGESDSFSKISMKRGKKANKKNLKNCVKKIK